MRIDPRLLSFILILVFGFGPFASAETYLRDVPDGHYAFDAVYDLIKQGVTHGYPDGTFHGKKLMSRYEIAAFLSKLARSFKVRQGVGEKLVEELRSEVSLLQEREEKARRETQVTGDLQARWRGGQTPGTQEARADYRLKGRLVRNFGETASLRINLDTMDAGFNGGQRDLAREILDVEGRVKLGSSLLKVTSGPGDLNHVDDGLFPFENGMKYRRPKRTVSLSTRLAKTEFSVEYLARSNGASGVIKVSEVSAKISQDFSQMKITLNPRYFSNTSGERDIRADLSAEFNFPKFFRSEITLGIAKTADYPNGLYVRGDLTVGEQIKVVAQKVGTQYREKFSYSLFDIFDRDVADGSSDLGLELTSNLGEHWFVKAKGDYSDPGEVLTAEIRLGCRSTESLSLELVYQAYRTSSVSQALGVEANIKL